MEKTPKTDEITNVVRQIAIVIDLTECNIDRIVQADDKNDEANKLIDAYKSNITLYQSCKISEKDIYNEYWTICPSIDDLPKYAKALAARFENLGFPTNLDAYLLDGAINNKVWTMEKQGFISKLQASDISCMLDLMAGYLQMWVNGIKHILEDMGIKPISNRRPKQDTEITIPKELDNDGAKKLLQKTIIAGLCDDAYKWVKSKALLAYFADKASEYLGLCKGEYDGKPKTSWKPFENLFSISGLSGAKRDYQKTGALPDGYSDVNKLFE